MSITKKLFVRVILTRLQTIGKRLPMRLPGKAVNDIYDFSLRQLQEKCKEQQQPLNATLVYLTKAFDVVSRDGLFKLLPKVGCSSKLIGHKRAFHGSIISLVNFDGTLFDWFSILNGVKQGCVLP